MTDTGTRETDAVVEVQRDIQREVAADDRQEEGAPTAMQARAREYPVPPFPEQHQAKPGEEGGLTPSLIRSSCDLSGWFQSVGKRGGCQAAKARVWSGLVVVGPPFFDAGTGVGHRQEPGSVPGIPGAAGC